MLQPTESEPGALPRAMRIRQADTTELQAPSPVEATSTRRRRTWRWLGPLLVPLLAVVAAVSGSAVRGASGAVAEPMRIYGGKYVSIRYPMDWRSVPPETAGFRTGGSLEFKVFASPGQGLAAQESYGLVLVVTANDALRKEAGRSDYLMLAREMRSQYPFLYPGTIVTHAVVMEANGRMMLRAKLTQETSGRALSKIQYLRISERYVYWLTLTAPDRQAGNLDNLAERIAETIEFVE